MDPSQPSRLVVAVATYRRPELLAGLLPVLVAQAGTTTPPARVVVVDNDPEGSAETTVGPWLSEGVEYAAEPRPGIAAARNRALDLAVGAEAIVFIDDDEVPRDGWLTRLWEAWQQWGCAAVAGPVISEMPAGVTDWVSRSGAFSRARRSTGTQLNSAATNNLLLDLAVLDRLALRFDDGFGLTGGSDTLLTRTLVSHGETMRWCDEAEVAETVPAERATRAWVLRRKTRSGNVWSRVRLQLAGRGPRRVYAGASLTLRGVFRIVRGTAQSVAGRATGNVELRAVGECDVATGVGVVRGVFGHRVVEYLRTG